MVRGINFRRGRNDYSWVRYKVWLVDWTNSQLLNESGWSGSIRVSDRRHRTSSGVDASQASHTGAYTLDVRLEWFKNGRLRGWWAYRLDNWHHWDVYNQGPFGPYPGCASVSNSQLLFPRPITPACPPARSAGLRTLASLPIRVQGRELVGVHRHRRPLRPLILVEPPQLPDRAHACGRVPRMASRRAFTPRRIGCTAAGAAPFA